MEKLEKEKNEEIEAKIADIEKCKHEIKFLKEEQKDMVYETPLE